ncbi:hypothetical protein D0Y65_041421, partial [Glycine soja]
EKREKGKDKKKLKFSFSCTSSASIVSPTSPLHHHRGDLRRGQRWFFCNHRWSCIFLSLTRCSTTSPSHWIEGTLRQCLRDNSLEICKESEHM